MTRTRTLGQSFAAVVCLGLWSLAPWATASNSHAQGTPSPIRIRDDSAFRAAALADGALIQLGGAGQRYRFLGDLCWSPDGERVLALGRDGRHVLLDARDGSTLGRLRGSSDTHLNCAATWTQRGTILLSASGSSEVFREVPGPPWGDGPAMAPMEGASLVAASADASTAVLIDAKSNWFALDLGTMSVKGTGPVGEDRESWSLATALSKDGSVAATVTTTAERPNVELWGTSGSDADYRRFYLAEAFLEKAAFDPEDPFAFSVALLDGAGAVAVSINGWVCVLDQATGEVLRTSEVSKAKIKRLEMAGSHLLGVDARGTIRSWTVPSLEPVGKADGYHSPEEMRAAPDGLRVAVLESGGRIRFLSVSESGRLGVEDERPADALAGGASRVFFGSDPDELLVGTPEGRVLSIHLPTMACREAPSRKYRLEGYVGAFVEWLGAPIALQDDGARFVHKRARGTAERPEVVRLSAFGFAPAASADGTALVSHTMERSVQFRSGRTGAIEFSDLESPGSAALSPSGKTAAFMVDYELRLIDTETMDVLYSGGADGVIGVDRSDFQVASVAGFLDENHLVVEYRDTSVRIVDVGGDVVATLPSPEEFSFLVGRHRPLLTADGERLFCAGADLGLRVFDLGTEQLLLTISGEAWSQGVLSWSVSVDGSYLAVARHGGAVDLWDLSQLTELAAEWSGGGGRSLPRELDPAVVAREQLGVGDYLRRSGQADAALAAYLRAEVAAPLGLNALEARAVQRRILAGADRAGADIEAWRAVRTARAAERDRVSVADVLSHSRRRERVRLMARLMDPLRAEPEAGEKLRAQNRIRSALRANPGKDRQLHLLGASHRMVALWEAAVASPRTGDAAWLQTRALDQLSLEPEGAERARWLAALPESDQAEERLGDAWRRLSEHLAGAGLSAAAREAMGQSHVWSRGGLGMGPGRRDRGELPDPAPNGAPGGLMAPERQPEAMPTDEPIGWPGAPPIRGDWAFGEAGVQLCSEALFWADFGNWVSVVRAGRTIECTLDSAFQNTGQVTIADSLGGGQRSVAVRARLTGDRTMGLSLGGGSLRVTISRAGPVLSVRAVEPRSGQLLLEGQRLLAGPTWAPFDWSVGLDGARSQLLVTVGGAEPLEAPLALEELEGAVSLIFGGLLSPGEVAIQGFRVR